MFTEEDGTTISEDKQILNKEKKAKIYSIS